MEAALCTAALNFLPEPCWLVQWRPRQQYSSLVLKERLDCMRLIIFSSADVHYLVSKFSQSVRVQHRDWSERLYTRRNNRVGSPPPGVDCACSSWLKNVLGAKHCQMCALSMSVSTQMI